MDRILIDLFSGKIQPQAEIVANPDDPEYSEISHRTTVIEEKLHAILGDQGEKLLDELTSCYAELSSYYSKIVFAYGFKLGARITNAVNTGDALYYRKCDKR